MEFTEKLFTITAGCRTTRLQRWRRCPRQSYILHLHRRGLVPHLIVDPLHHGLELLLGATLVELGDAILAEAQEAPPAWKVAATWLRDRIQPRQTQLPAAPGLDVEPEP